MRSPKTFQVAYYHDKEGRPLFLPVIPRPHIREHLDIDNWFRQMESEQAIAARIVAHDDVIEQRNFAPRTISAERVYMVYHLRYASKPFPATLAQIREKFRNRTDVFCETRNGLVAINQSGAEYIAMPVPQFRTVVAGYGPLGVPVCRPGDAVPMDRTYVQVSKHYRIGHWTRPRHSTLRPWHGRRTVIPFVNGRPLWDAATIEHFLKQGEAEAILAAQEAIGLVRVPGYDPVEHYRRLTGQTGEFDDMEME